ncbi:hypothetical protein N9C39_05220 [Luminiphilus sp.]|nr:hypothetical protein [Luminiphilus sp.]
MKQAAVAILWGAFAPNNGKTAAQNTIVMAPRDAGKGGCVAEALRIASWARDPISAKSVTERRLQGVIGHKIEYEIRRQRFGKNRPFGP